MALDFTNECLQNLKYIVTKMENFSKYLLNIHVIFEQFNKYQ